MVSEKDAAIKRQKAREEYSKRYIEELEKNTIKFRWYVEEVTPAYEGFGYYDNGTPRKTVIVSPYFDTEEAAVDWMDSHVADQGKHLNLVRQRLLRQVTHTWTRG